VIGLLLHYTYDLGIGSLSFPVNFQAVGSALLYIALIITLLTGIDYFYRFFKRVFEQTSNSDITRQ
jgi:hypothetical protein